MSGGFRKHGEDPISNTLLDISRGLVTGAQAMRGFGQRSSISTGVNGEDVWPGTSVLIPTPADAGDAMEVVSSSTSDTAAGTGTQALEVHYLDPSGNPQTTPATMNGTTPVALTPIDVRFVQRVHSTAVGSNGVAVGDIDVRKISAPADVYSRIAAGGNMSLVPHRMVPLGKVLVIYGWHATESQDRRVGFRLRATADDETLHPGVFIFQDTMFLAKAALSKSVLISIPALSIVKITGFGDAVGGEASCGWNGVLFDA